MTNLKNCPFCGSKPEFPEAKEVIGTCYEAGCNACGIPTISIQIIDCFDCPRDRIYDSWDNVNHKYGVEYIEVARQEAINDWNDRVPQTRDKLWMKI